MEQLEIVSTFWWLSPNIDWSNIGSDVVHRPTELLAFQNMQQSANYIRQIGVREIDLELTKTERKIYELDLFVMSSKFDYKDFSNKGVFKKDSPVRKVSKISGYSETFVLSKMANISKKMYLRELFGYS